MASTSPFPQCQESTSNLSSMLPELQLALLDSLVRTPGSFIALVSTNRYWYHSVYGARKASFLPGLVAATMPQKALFHAVRMYELVNRYACEPRRLGGRGFAETEMAGDSRDTEVPESGSEGIATVTIIGPEASQPRGYGSITPAILQSLLSADDRRYAPNPRVSVSEGYHQDLGGAPSTIRWADMEGLGWNEDEIRAWTRQLGSERLQRMLAVYQRFLRIAKMVAPKKVWEKSGRGLEFTSRIRRSIGMRASPAEVHDFGLLAESTFGSSGNFTRRATDTPKSVNDEDEEALKEEKMKESLWSQSFRGYIRVVIPCAYLPPSVSATHVTHVKNESLKFILRLLPTLIYTNLRDRFPRRIFRQTDQTPYEPSEEEILSTFFTAHGVENYCVNLRYGAVQGAGDLLQAKLIGRMEKLDGKEMVERLCIDAGFPKHFWPSDGTWAGKINIADRGKMIGSPHDKLARSIKNGYNLDEMVEMLEGVEAGDRLLRGKMEAARERERLEREEQMKRHRERVEAEEMAWRNRNTFTRSRERDYPTQS